MLVVFRVLYGPGPMFAQFDGAAHFAWFVPVLRGGTSSSKTGNSRPRSDTASHRFSI